MELINHSDPMTVNALAIGGYGTPRGADFTKVDLSDLGRSIQNCASDNGKLQAAIERANESGVGQYIYINNLRAGGGLDGSTPWMQKLGMGRFSVDVAGMVRTDRRGNWTFDARVTGEEDKQDYPYDATRTLIDTIITGIGAGAQFLHGGEDYTIYYFGTYKIRASGPE